MPDQGIGLLVKLSRDRERVGDVIQRPAAGVLVVAGLPELASAREASAGPVAPMREQLESTLTPLPYPPAWRAGASA